MRRRRLDEQLYLPGNAFPLTVSAAIAGIGGALVTPYQSVYFSELGTDVSVIGSLLALGSAITALVQLVGGYLADSWSRRNIISIFGFVGVASSLLFACIPDSTYLIVPILVASISNIYGPAFNAMLVDSMPSSLVARGMASFKLITSLSSIICPVVGGWLLSRYGILTGVRGAFLVSAIFACLGVSYRAFSITDTFPCPIKTHVKPAQFFVQCLKEIGSVLKHMGRGTIMLLSFSMIMSVAVGITAPYTALYAIDVLKMPPSRYGLAVTVSGIISVILLPIAARIIEQIGVKISVTGALLIMAINQFLFVQITTISSLFVWSIVIGVCTALLTPSLSALQAIYSTQEQRGRLLALFNVFAFTAAIPAQIGGGKLYSLWRPQIPFVLSIPLFAISALLLTKLEGYSPQLASRVS